MNLLLTGAFNWAEKEIEELKSLGHNVLFMQYEKNALPCAYSWAEGVIGNGIFLHHPIEKFTNLKYIQLTSAGFDRVPMDYVEQNNIKIHNAKGVYSIPMAEFAVWGVLSLYKDGKFFIKNQEKHIWEKHRGIYELSGKTVCVVGCGSVGNECAKRFKVFGCSVLGVDIAPCRNELYEDMISAKELKSILPKSDIVILTLPLEEATKGLFNEETFGFMKSGSLLVNISRGGVVETKALINALENNLGGAVLDVFETEPLDENSPLWSMGNVIVTPHNSFVGENNHQRLYDLITENLKQG